MHCYRMESTKFRTVAKARGANPGHARGIDGKELGARRCVVAGDQDAAHGHKTCRANVLLSLSLKHCSEISQTRFHTVVCRRKERIDACMRRFSRSTAAK